MQLKFRIIIISFFLIASICTITFLHRNYIALHHFSFAEWLLNYQHSFVRRGIIGEINFNLSQFLNINLLKLTFLTQSFLYCIFYLLCVRIFLNLKDIPFLLLLSILSPIGFLFPLGEIEALGRQEIVFLCFFSFYLWMIIFTKKIYLSQIVLVLGLSFVLLSHEGMIFFFSYIFIINYFFLINQSIKKSFLINFSMVTLIVIFFGLLNFNITVDQLAVDGICKSLSDYLEYSHCTAINGIYKISEAKSVTVNQFLNHIKLFGVFPILKFSIFAIIGFIPLIILLDNRKHIKFFNFLIKPVYFIFLCLFCSIPIYFAIDWGRWTSINYICTLFLFVYLIHINVLNIKKGDIFSFFEKLTNSLKFFIFIIFCLSWNLKILLTDDIGSLPAYRLIRKTILYLNTFF